MTTCLESALHLTWTPTDPQRLALAQRWRLTTERLVEARHHFRRLSDAESIDIRALRRAMEESGREDASASHRAGPALPTAGLRV